MNQTPAELRNAAARQLIARGRMRQALDLLNEAIRLDPRLAESYQNRAEVFEALNMRPQADADRRKFVELGGVVRPAEPEAPPPPSKTKIRRRPPAAIGIRYPTPKKRRAGLGAFTQTGVTALAVLALVAAGGIGIFIAVSTLGDAISGDDSTEVVVGTGTPTVEPTPAPTDENGNTPTPAPTKAPTATLVPTPESLADALSGSPLSFSSLQAAWAEKGITAKAERVSDDVTGTSTTPVAVTLSKGDATMHLAVLFYTDASGPATDFDLGDTVAPKEGRSIPGGAYGWWHSNVVAIVLDQDDSIKPDAFDAFLNA